MGGNVAGGCDNLESPQLVSRLVDMGCEAGSNEMAVLVGSYALSRGRGLL